MDLTLTRRADYVVRAAIELARHHQTGQFEKAEQLAQATKIPTGYVRQILRMLVQHRIAEARAGSAGGYRLLRSPSRISVLQLVEIGEGPLVNQKCVMRGLGCDPRHPCLIHAVMAASQEALRVELRAATLQELLSKR